MAYEIFLSHSSTDGQWVKWIAANASNVGIAVYLHEYDPQPGVYIADKVQTAIRGCDALVVLLTRRSQYSPYVHEEIGFAKGHGKRVIPLVEPGVEQRSLAMLEGTEHVVFDFHEPEKALLQLLTYLQRLKKAKENEQGVLIGLGVLVLLALFLTSSK